MTFNQVESNIWIMSIAPEPSYIASNVELTAFDWHSIAGSISRIYRGNLDELHITATEFLDIDVDGLPRMPDGDFVLRGRAHTLRQHGKIAVGDDVKALVRPFWAHVSISLGKPVVWVLKND